MFEKRKQNCNNVGRFELMLPIQIPLGKGGDQSEALMSKEMSMLVRLALVAACIEVVICISLCVAFFLRAIPYAFSPIFLNLASKEGTVYSEMFCNPTRSRHFIEALHIAIIFCT